MSIVTDRINSKRQTAADLENFATKMESNIETMNKGFIKKMLNTLNSITTIAQRKENGIFRLILKWFRLYLKLPIVINPDDKKLFKYYENSVPTIITYIIGCLQFKVKEVPNYHYDLLEILEDLLKNINPRVLKKISNFEKGTIGCLWRSIDLAGDFNTQLKALKILSLLLKQFDEAGQNEELKYIKWTNLNLFQNKLKTIVQETKLPHILENSSRDLLNSYNMNLSKNVTVYSFFCKSAILGNQYKFYKPLNLQKFWIDINYCPKTLSYNGRFKLNSSSQYEIINVVLKIQKIELENNILQIYYNKPGDFSKYSNYLSNVSKDVIKFALTNDEKQRLIDNDYIIEYFNSLKKTNTGNRSKTDKEDIFDSLKNEMSNNIQDVETDSPKSSKKVKTNIEKQPTRKLRGKKTFFTSLVMDESDEEYIVKKKQRKRKPRQTKSRCKQVCKVTPTVDLTKIESKVSMSQNELIMTNQTITRDEGHRQVADVYETGDATYAKPCQSYRNFQTVFNPIQPIADIKNSTKGRKKKIIPENQSSVEKRRKLTNSYSRENKENIKPKSKSHNINKKHRPLSMTNSNMSPHLFETQRSVETPYLKQLPITTKTNTTKFVEKIEIDLTLNEIKSPICREENKNKKDTDKENISLSSSSECEELRCLDENCLKDIDYISSPNKNMLINSCKVTTPRPPSSMHISILNDSDMELTQIANYQNSKMKRKTTINDTNDITLQKDGSDMELIKSNEETFENNHRNTTKQKTDCVALKENIEILSNFEQILKDFEYSSDDEPDFKNIRTNKGPGDIMPKNFVHNNLLESNYNRDCIIFKSRINTEESSSSEEDIISDELVGVSNVHKKTNLPIIENMPFTLNKNLGQNTTPADKNRQISTNLTSRTATSCQVTPTAIIMHQFQISAKKSIILRNKYNKVKKVSKSNKCLNKYFAKKSPNKKSMEQQSETLKKSKQNLKFFEEGNLSLLPNTKPTYNKVLQAQDHTNTASLEVDTISENFNKMIRSCFNVYPATNPADNNEHIEEQHASSSFSSSDENNSVDCGGYNMSNQSSQLGNFEKSFKNDLLKIINDYTTNIKQCLDNALGSGLKNISDIYSRKFLEIIKAVLKLSDENKIELDQIRMNIGRLVRELEWQYDAFMKKSNDFDIHREITKRVLENITNVNVSNFITNKCEDAFQQLNIENKEVIQKVWQKYMENKFNK